MNHQIPQPSVAPATGGPGQPGENVLAVVFDSAWADARAVQTQLGPLPNAYPAPFNFIRKMACNLGWDWGRTVFTVGIWRPIAMESWTAARLAQVGPQVTVWESTRTVKLQVDCEDTADVDSALTVTIGTAHTRVVIAAGEQRTKVQLHLPDVQLWWPHGMGAQPLYDLQVEPS